MKRQSINSISFFVAGALFGSLATFFFDPVRGTYRRAVVRDKSFRVKNKLLKRSGKIFRDLKNKTIGLKFRTKKIITTEGVIQDEVLNARVRSKFGRLVSHPKSVFVYAHDGIVVLSGPILKREVKDLVKCVKKVAGVKKVVNDLTAYASNKGISALQGDGPAYLHD